MATERSILAVHGGALGDAIIMGHLLAALGGRTTLVARGQLAELLGRTAARAALDFDLLPIHEVFTDAPLATCRLPGLLGRHDWLISCFAGGQERAEGRLAEMCGARRADFLPTRPPADFDGHLLDLWWRMLHQAGSPQPPRWSVPTAWRRRAERLLAGKGVASGDDRPYAVLHPGAGAPRKCWPLDRFIELAGRLRGRGAGVVFTLGPAELERWPNANLDRLRGQFVTLEDQPLTVLAGALSSAACYVGNDSGVTHLAAAAGAATIALFGPTDPRHFRPVGQNVAVIARPTLDEIEVDDVLEAIGNRLA